jgi:hypothetical protein
MEIVGLSSIVLLLITVAVVVGLQPKGKHHSISGHASSSSRSYVFFACSMSVFGSLLIFYLLDSFGPKFGLPIVYYLALSAGWVSLLLTAWIPDRSPYGISTLHWRSAYTLRCCMALATGSIGFARHVDLAIRVIGFALFLWYCYTLCILFTDKDHYREEF